MFKINYLSPLQGKATKTFIFRGGEWEAKKIQIGTRFDGYSYPVENLRAAFEVISKCAAYPMFMIQGDFIPGINLKGMVRVKRADKRDPRTGEPMPPTIQDRELQLICFDVDGFFPQSKGTEAIEEFIAEMPTEFWEADYIYQFSASHGLKKMGLKCHLFFWLESPVPALDIRQWVIAYNKEKKRGNVLDPSVFVAVQPIFTSRRICFGAPDPVEDLIGFVQKSGNLSWSPPPSQISSAVKIGPEKKYPEEKYSLSRSVQMILTGANFHDEINKLALSLMSQGLPARQIKATIRGIMLAAKENISGPRLRDWQIRFDDIDRSVESAFELIKNPNQEDLIAWIETAPIEVVLKEFPGKTFKKTDEELTAILKKLSERTNIGKRELKKRLKGFKEEIESLSRNEKREKLYLDRKKRGIYEVVVNHHNLFAAAAQVTKILAQSARWPPVFFYGSSLVYIDYAHLTTIRQVKRLSDVDNGSENREPAIFPFNKPYHDLIARMGRDVRFVRWEMGKEISCPEKLASVVATGMTEKHRELTGVIRSPFIDDKWELFCKKGYDARTGLFSVIEDKPPTTYMAPQYAYEYLRNEVLAEFPFQTELDAAVAISMFLALLQRPLLAQDPAGMPGFGVIAPVPSSGKTTLVKLATLAILKMIIPASNFSTDEEELAKHILAVLQEGHNCVLFDNITHGTEIKSDVLAKAMSSEIYSGRLLGQNRTARAPAAAVWIFTGNNIRFSGDFSTRIYPINVVPKMENPDTRSFLRNIPDWTPEHRKSIVWALISIVRCGEHIEPLPTGSRFNLWDKFVRNPLYNASGVDINDSIISNKKHDVDFTTKRALINEIYAIWDNAEFTTRALIVRGFPEESSKPTTLGEILEDIMGEKYSRAAKSVGKLLSKMVGRAFGDLTLTRTDADRAFWSISKID